MPDFSTRPRRRRVQPAEAVFLATAALALLLAARAAWAAWEDLGSVRAELAAMRREAESAAARTRELESARSDDALVMQALLTVEAPPPRVLGEIGQLLPGDARLEAVGFEYGDRLKLQVRLTARSSGSYDVFLSRLEGSRAFAEVAPGEETRDGGIHGVIRMTYRGAGS
ncbi:MAG TPA: hypothetical protein VGQ78_09365 [Vicinamibacteria bacterium]|jgi:hypothetical protein|nr:hypothetical protein [Vicinamibacteria bacterium]